MAISAEGGLYLFYQQHNRAKQAVKTINHKRTCKRDVWEQNGVKPVWIYGMFSLPYPSAQDEATDPLMSLQLRFALCKTGTYLQARGKQREGLCSTRDALPYLQRGSA